MTALQNEITLGYTYDPYYRGSDAPATFSGSYSFFIIMRIFN